MHSRALEEVRNATPPPGPSGGGRPPRQGSARGARRGCRRLPAPARARRRSSCDHRLHGARETAPFAPALGELVAPAAREPIHAPPPAVPRRPGARELASSLETVQGRIQRALGQDEDIAAALPQALEDQVAVRRLLLERGQDQEVEMAPQYLASHSLVMLGITTRSVKRFSPPFRTLLARTDLVATHLLSPQPVVPAHLERTELALELPVARPALGRERAVQQRLTDRAAGLAAVRAVGEPTARRDRLDVPECLLEVAVPETKLADAGRVEHDAAVGKHDELTPGRRVPAVVILGPHLLRREQLGPGERVDECRLADAG